jgi:hypothetical protein
LGLLSDRSSYRKLSKTTRTWPAPPSHQLWGYTKTVSSFLWRTTRYYMVEAK